MAGHSRWAQVKHRKAGADAKRGALFSKLARLISVAAREGGPVLEANPRLRQTVEQAKDAGMPKGNIERAIARAGGKTGTEELKNVEYEAYGPGGIALLISGLTDNPNRTTAELKRLLEDAGGRLTEAGSVAWMFERRAVLDVAIPTGRSADSVELTAIDAGAEDTAPGSDLVRAIVPPERAEEFEGAIGREGLTVVRSELALRPKTTVATPSGTGAQVTELVATIRDHPDVIAVWTNAA